MTISLVNGSTTHPVNLINTGIAWSTDVNSKFKNPDSKFSGQISSVFTAFECINLENICIKVLVVVTMVF